MEYGVSSSETAKNQEPRLLFYFGPPVPRIGIGLPTSDLFRFRSEASVDYIHHLFHADPQFLFYFKIPESQHGPAFGKVKPVDFAVPLHVSFYFRDPEAVVGLDAGFTGIPVMAVPEGPVNEDHQLVFDQRDIRFAWESPTVAAVAEAGMPQGFFEAYFGFGIFASDPGHVIGPLLGGIETVFFAELGYCDFWFLIYFHKQGPVLDWTR